ncbi:MAG: aminopeptidase, partial [Pyrinomonadaceae bacterium]|nr:aminopeptidase [Pyrinomonadaceae bacterium]
MSLRRATALLLLVLFASISISAQSKTKPSDKFRQLEGELPTPNEQRTASGAPGNKYWQQRADYNIDVELDDVNQRIIGKETVTYKNNSPDTLDYIWLQLDQNIFAKDSGAEKTRTAPDFKSVPLRTIDQLVNREGDFKVKIDYVRDGANKNLKYVVNDTMMRIDLPTPLLPNQQFVFSLAWNYNITNARVFGGRTGYEFFPQDGNYIYEMAQWFPRLAAYHDSYGWQHKQFLGSGE